MIPVLETKDGFQRISGAEVLTSLDGEVKAPLGVLLHHSWTDEARAKFGVFLVEPMAIPEGKEAVGMPRYERDRSGRVVQVRDLEDAKPPEQSPMEVLRAEMDALAKRVDALEARR